MKERKHKNYSEWNHCDKPHLGYPESSREAAQSEGTAERSAATPKGEKMTAMERAKSCLPGCYDPTGRECTADERCEIHFRVAHEIKAAEDAAYDEGVETALKVVSCDDCYVKGLNHSGCKEAYAKGFAEAVKKAANICDECYLNLLANKIRALRPSGSGEGGK